MARLTRPAYVLAHIADLGGCGYHRILHPLETLSRQGYVNGKADMNIWLTSQHNLQALNPDVVIWQRQHDDAQIANIKKYRELLPNTFHIWELDDILSAVPDWSPHKHLIPANIDDKMRKAVAVCDAVVVSTEPLARHVRSICEPGTEVRVVPNMLTQDDIQKTRDIKNKQKMDFGRVRIGWMGGMGHKGDLDLLTPAMRELSNKGVDWVFFGQRPYCEVPVEFHGGVPPNDYLGYYASLRLDLALAPLEHSMFNECKSNLRMLEAGILGIPVIASRITPYLEREPPVFAYAETPQEWLHKIQEFLVNREAAYNAGLALQKWVFKNYIIDEQLERRTRMWLPRDTNPFIPKQRPARDSGVVIVSPGKALFPKRYTTFKTVQEAATNSNSDVVYVREGTTVSESQIDRLLRRLRMPGTGSITPLSNDGGAAGFPQVGRFTPVEDEFGTNIDNICQQMFAPVKAELAAGAGPVVALSRVALDMCGAPEQAESDAEAAIAEWTALASAKGFTNWVGADVYVTTTSQHDYAGLPMLFEKIRSRYTGKQLAPDPVAGVRWELDLEFHRRYYKTPLPSANGGYPEWALLFNKLGTRDIEVLEKMVSPVDLVFVSYPVKLDTLREIVTGRLAAWIVFYANETNVAEQSVYFFSKAIEENPDVAFVYADHDVQLDNGTQDAHFFKPHKLDIHMLAQNDYITQLLAVRAAPFVGAFGTFGEETVSELSLYRMMLETAWDPTFKPELAVHIPRVLAHLKQPAGGEFFSAVANKCAIANKTLMQYGVTVQSNPRLPLLGELSYSKYMFDAEPIPAPKVTIVILTTCNIALLSPALTSLLALTSYANFEVVVVVNGKVDKDGLTYLEGVVAQDSRVSMLTYKDTFNWSVLNNWAAKRTSGELLLFLNDDVQFIEEQWLSEMVGASMQFNVGAVGARLTFPNALVQHVGVFCHKGNAGHHHKGAPEGHPGYNGLAFMSHQATAVTGACLLVKREVFEEVGGFDRTFAFNFNDVAFCLELNRLGYVNVVAARANLRHFEGSTRTAGKQDEAMMQLRRDSVIMVQNYPEPDPYWNENLLLKHFEEGTMVMGGNLDMQQWPATAWPWRGDNWDRDVVLILGDDGTGWFKEVQNGNIVYHAVLNGMSLQIARPALANLPPLDIREAAMPMTIIGKLGINKIVVRSIIGGTVEVLPFLLNLNVPIVYEPASPEAVCPRLDFRTLSGGEFKDCERGWEKKERCQDCMRVSGSVFGCVSITGWREQWNSFMQTAEIYTAPDERTADAIAEVYPDRKSKDAFSLDDWNTDETPSLVEVAE